MKFIHEFMEQNLKCHLVTETGGTSACKSSLSTEIIPRASENSGISGTEYVENETVF